MTDAEIFALTPHPLALRLPRDEESLPALAASVGLEGMREECVLLGNEIVDGNRRREAYRMAVAQGVRPPGGFRWRFFNPKSDGDLWDFILCKAVQHRAAPKGDAALPLLREELARNYRRSDRSIAARTGLHHTKVKEARLAMERDGAIPRVDERLDAAGRARRAHAQPPPDAGDAWEPPAEGSQEAKEDRAVARAALATFDPLGAEIPRHLRDDFADGFYEDCWTSLAWMAKHVGANPKRYVRLHLKPEREPAYRQLSRLAESMQDVLEHHRPYCVCPACKGAEGGCPDCFSTGWLSAGQYQERESYKA